MERPRKELPKAPPVVVRRISVPKLFAREPDEITRFLASPNDLTTYPYHSLAAMYDYAREREVLAWTLQEIRRYLKTLTNLAIVIHDGKSFTGRHSDEALGWCTNLVRLHLVIADDTMTNASALKFAQSKFEDGFFPATLATITFASTEPMLKNRLSILTRETDASRGWEEFGKRELRFWGRAMDPVVIKHDAAWGERFVGNRQEIELIRPGFLDDGKNRADSKDYPDRRKFRFMYNFEPVLVWKWVVFTYDAGGVHPQSWTAEIKAFAEE